MPRITYVNGRYVPHAKAMVHVEDRGYQFSDGVYEVAAFYHRRLLDEAAHFKRLQRSLKELAIPLPMPVKALQAVAQELIERNGKAHANLYIQITRGVAKRDHPYPTQMRPSLVMMVMTAKNPKEKEIEEGVAVITRPDIRWGRRDIKSISLLPNILARQESAAMKLRETWLIDERGMVTEGAASNSYIISRNSTLITHPADHHILGGITREVVLELARAQGIRVEERPFSKEEAYEAKEAFLTSTSANVLPVVRIDDRSIGNGQPGLITQQLLGAYWEHIKQQTGYDFAA